MINEYKTADFLGWVSVIVPTYNRAQLIKETLESIRIQTYRPIEVIIVDDGSNDNTQQTVEDWMIVTASSYFKVKYYYKKNQGVSAARNYGIEKATGRYIQFLDSDDILSFNKIASQVNFLNANNDIDFAYGPVCDLENSERIVYIQSELTFERQISKQISFSTFTTIGPLCRERMVKKLGPWDETMTNFEDWEYFSRASVMGFIGGFVPDAVSYYRMKGPVRDRLSKVDSQNKIVAYTYGRFRHLDSMRLNAIPRIKQSHFFRNKLAQQWMYITAEAVLMGWSGNDARRYADARNIGFWHAYILSTTTLWIRSLFGRHVAARYILIYPWIYFRWHAIRLRIAKYAMIIMVNWKKISDFSDVEKK